MEVMKQILGDDASLTEPIDSIIEEIQPMFEDAEQTYSPIVVDLDGDGVETVRQSKTLHFDLDNNGFAEQTGWVGADDGLLVHDLNGNGVIDSGTELFGNNTVLTNGQKAANGFEAIAELDSNHDGVIDANDTSFASLRIWKDVNENGVTDSGELMTLGDAGVASIGYQYILYECICDRCARKQAPSIRELHKHNRTDPIDG